MSSALSEGLYKEQLNQKFCARETRNEQRSLALKTGQPRQASTQNDSLFVYSYTGQSPIVNSKSKALYSFSKTDRFQVMKSFS